MKNTIKMSLVAAVAVAGFTTTSSAATLAEAFAASTVKGEIKSQYWQKEKSTGTDATSSIFVNGGNISIKTGSYNGLTAGVTFQSSHVSDLDDVNGNYLGDEDASGTVASEAYLEYTIANTTAKVGRQYISTPLIAGSGSRFIRESFEAALLINTDIPDTTIVAGKVTKFQGRTDSAGAPGTFDAYEDGAYTLYVTNNSIPNLTLKGQYVDASMLADPSVPADGVLAEDARDLEIMYISADYKLDFATISAQTIQSDNGKANVGSKGKLYGVQVAGNIQDLSLSAGFTSTDNEADVAWGIGAGAWWTYASPYIAGNSYAADTEAYKLTASYPLTSDLGLSVWHSGWDVATAATVTETDYMVDYQINKEFSAKILHAVFDNYDYDTSSRIYLSYKF